MPRRPFRKGILTFVSNVFDLPLVGKFKTLHVMLFLLAVALANAVRSLKLVEQQMAAAANFATPNWEVAHLSKRWRAERNLWLAGFAFARWATLAAFYREARKRLQLEDRLAEAEMSETYTATADTTRDKEVSSRLTGHATPRSPAKAPAAPAVPRTAAPAAVPGLAAGAGLVPVAKFAKKDQ
jgi:hypothetical protein